MWGGIGGVVRGEKERGKDDLERDGVKERRNGGRGEKKERRRGRKRTGEVGKGKRGNDEDEEANEEGRKRK